MELVYNTHPNSFHISGDYQLRHGNSGGLEEQLSILDRNME